MNNYDLEPIRGQIITARSVLRQANILPDKLEPKDPDMGDGRKPRLRVKEAAWGISTIGVVTLFLAAMLQGERQYMQYLFYGLSPWFVCYGLIVLLKRQKLASQNGIIRDEGMISRLDWLRERTRSGVLEEPRTKRGTLVWMTYDGLYTDSGRRFSWTDFTSFRIISSNNANLTNNYVHQVELKLRPGSTRLALAMASITSLLVLLGSSIMFYAMALGFHRYGFRDDVLMLSIYKCFKIYTG